MNRLYYTLGTGIEDNALFGVKASPRATVAYYLWPGVKAHASFGEGIKEPSVYQQTSSLYNTLAALPNGASLIQQFHVSQVGAERARTFDGGVDRDLGRRGKAGITYFHNQFSNGVEYVPEQGLTELGVPVSVAQAAEFGAYVNSLTVVSKGVELEADYRWGGFSLRGGYTYLDAVVQRSFSSDALSPTYNPAFPTIAIGAYSPLVAARPFRQAPHSGYFMFSYEHNRWSGSVTGTLVSRRDDSDFLLYDKDGNPTMLLPNRNLDPSYQNIGFSGRYRLNRFASLYSTVQNLFSEHYVETIGYPALPFTFHSGVQLTFGGESWK
jgi:iron complex outermembrane receptor protein/vitamin B12 transporter